MNYKFDSLTIEPGSKCATMHSIDGFTVYGHGTYPYSSVLGGQPSRTYVKHFETLEDAQKAYPQAEVISGSTYQQFLMPVNPPDWFDPMDAGERWSEYEY